jgi:benzoyl-CoA reductase subunit D
MITAGIDCGAKNTKTVIMKDGHIIAKAMVFTGFDHKEAIERSLARAVEAAGISEDDLNEIGGTGSGRESIDVAGVMVNDIKAMAKAAFHYFPNSRTVCDMGAEEGKAARIDENGNPVDFAINEKCAAGGGAFIETMSRALEIPLEEIGPLALTSRASIPIHAQCVVFLESEVVGLIHAKISKADISKAIHDAMASRVVSMIRRIGVNPDVVLMGGMAHNPGFVFALEREMNLGRICIPNDPEYGAALGAAIGAIESEVRRIDRK